MHMSKTPSKKNQTSKEKKTAPAQESRPTSRRRFTRFNPDEGAMAFIVSDAKYKKLAVPVQCLILEEAFAGCGLVAIDPGFIKKGAKFEVKVGHLPVLKCEVRWLKVLEAKVVSFGVYFLE